MPVFAFVGPDEGCTAVVAQSVFRELLIPRNIADEVSLLACGERPAPMPSSACAQLFNAAQRRGIELTPAQEAPCASTALARCDAIFAMDRDTQQRLWDQLPSPQHAKVELFLAHAPELGPDIPAPAFEDPAQIEALLDLIEEGAQALLMHLLQTTICP